MLLRKTVAVAFTVLNLLEAVAQENGQQEPKPDCRSVVRPDQCECKKPTYPVESLRLNEQGTTVVKVGVDHDGLVSRVEILQSSGSTNLDRATLDHFKNLCFKPARDAAGNNIPSSTIVKYIWRIE